jgi:hypothetical protein
MAVYRSMTRIALFSMLGLALVSGVAAAEPTPTRAPARRGPAVKKPKVEATIPLSEHDKLLLAAKKKLENEICLCKEGTLAPIAGRMKVQSVQRDFRDLVEVQCMVPAPPSTQPVVVPGNDSSPPKKACNDFITP